MCVCVCVCVCVCIYIYIYIYIYHIHVIKNVAKECLNRTQNSTVILRRTQRVNLLDYCFILPAEWV